MTQQKKLNLISGANVPENFSDLVQVSINNDIVKLNFASKRSESEEEVTAEIKSTIVMTLSHFINVADIFQNASNRVQEELNKTKRKE